MMDDCLNVCSLYNCMSINVIKKGYKKYYFGSIKNTNPGPYHRPTGDDENDGRGVKISKNLHSVRVS